jgi:TRAP-type C4-dicarboxylate transport system substrate-binding protein
VRRALCAAAVCSTLVLSSCADSSDAESSGSGAGGEGVEFGATMEEYQAAFEDIDPIELHTQTPSPKGSSSGARNEAFIAAVEEWSGGKITFDVQYSSAVAEPGESDNALYDGRLDIANVMPVYEPADYPANGMINTVSFLGTQKPAIGPMAAQGWMLQAAYDTPEVLEEYRKVGVELLLPSFNSGLNLVICKDPASSLSDYKGRQIIAGGVTQSKELEALGGAPVSIPFTEVFESLQRGVADCTGSTLLGADLGGYIPEANNVSFSPDAGFAITTGTFGISASVWEQLPLVAKQLLFDRLDVYIEEGVRGTYTAAANAVAAIEKEGGGFTLMDADAESALQSANESILEEARGSTVLADPEGFVDSVEANSAAWEQKITDLGFPDTNDYAEFADWWNGGDVDLQPFVDLLYDDVLLDHRPSA